MDLEEKLSILTGAAQYDAAGATGGTGITDGHCVKLLKVLYSNVCRFDCAYCVNRASADIRHPSPPRNSWN
ncbi:MAG: hypothetical protein LBT13_07625 [Treponema sp.]|nr:hypothetical protein [Treponema sp.]